MQSTVTSTATKPVNDNTNYEESSFDCNICLDVAKEPVVTLCGHLYCWRCLCRWFHSIQTANVCPVCKAGVEIGKVIPIYCRGGKKHEKDEKPDNLPIPPRPQGQRPVPIYRNSIVDAQYTSQPGILPMLFGIRSGGYGNVMTPEQQHQAFLSRLLLLLGSFVILCLLMF